MSSITSENLNLWNVLFHIAMNDFAARMITINLKTFAILCREQLPYVKESPSKRHVSNLSKGYF